MFFLLQNWRIEGQNWLWQEVMILVGGGGNRESVKEGEYVQILCTHLCKCEKNTCYNYSGNGGRGKWWKG
jgi:hypothetical protein